MRAQEQKMKVWNEHSRSEKCNLVGGHLGHDLVERVRARLWIAFYATLRKLNS